MSALSLPCPECMRPLDLRPAVLTGKFRGRVFELAFDKVWCCDSCGAHVLWGRAGEFREKLKQAYLDVVGRPHVDV